MDKQQKKIITIALIIVSIITITSLILKINQRKQIKKAKFTIPEIEQKAQEGKPNMIEKELMYNEVKINDNFIIYICGVPKIKENTLTLYFTSVKTNTELIKIKILDSKNNTIGESGLLNSNSYLKEIELTKKLKDKEKITIKVMGYEKETYYSAGSIKLDVFVKKTN